MFGVEDSTILVKVAYLVINVPYSYNMVIWRPTFNQLGVTLSILCQCMKYTFPNGRVGVN